MISIAAKRRQLLVPFHREEQAPLVEYRAMAGTCNVCPVKRYCTPSTRGRHTAPFLFCSPTWDRVKGYQKTLASQQARNKRKVWFEPLFAEGKQWHGMRRFRLRRLWRVNGEALVIASGQNLKSWLQKRGWGRRPFPADAVATGVPPAWEVDAIRRENTLKSRSVRSAVAAVALLSATRMWLDTQKHLVPAAIVDRVTISVFLSLLFLALFSLTGEKGEEVTQPLGSHSLTSSAKSFSTGCDRL